MAAFLAASKALSDPAEVPEGSGLELVLDAAVPEDALDWALGACWPGFFLEADLRLSESVERPPLLAALACEAEEFSESEELESLPEEEDELDELDELLLPDVDSELVVG